MVEIPGFGTVRAFCPKTTDQSTRICRGVLESFAYGRHNSPPTSSTRGYKADMATESAIAPPTLVAMILCQYTQELATGSVNLLELYHSYNAPSYPILMNSRLYVRLEDATQGLKLRLDFLNAATIEAIGEGIEMVVGEVDSCGCWTDILELDLDVPAPGEYILQLMYGEKIVGRFTFPAYLMEQPSQE